jgi:hypothetical protein
VRFIVQYQGASGMQRREFTVPGTIGAGQSANVATGLGPYEQGAGCPVQISAARVAE